MAYNTNNPLGSSDPRDLFDNASIFDKYMTGSDEIVYDRFDQPRWAPQAFHNLVINAKAQIDPTVAAAKAAVNTAADSAILEMEQTAANLGSDLNNKRYASYAAMNADPQTRDAVVAVVDGDPDINLDGWYGWNNTTKKWVRFVSQPARQSEVNSINGRTAVLEARAVQTDQVADENFVDSIRDEYGQVAFGIRKNGTVYAGGISEKLQDLENFTPLQTPIEDTTIVDGLIDKDGYIGYGVNAYGEFIGLMQPGSVSAISSYIVRGASISGLTVNLGASLIRTGDQNFALNAVTLAAATDVTEKVTDYPLTYITPVSMPITEFLKVDAAQWLGYSSVNIVSVINQADGQTLVPGVDYAWTENGKLVRMTSGAALTVTVNFIGHKERYDLIAYNDITRNVVVRQGTERRITAQEDAYRPKLQQGDIGLYMAYVVGGVIKDLVDISGWRGVRNRATSGEMARLIESNRYRLRRFLCKLVRGDGVIVTGYGDSNTALGGTRGTDAAYLPNRPGVDTLAFQGDYLMSSFESDFRDTYLASVGKVTVNSQERYKTSPNWSVIDKIVSGYGYTFAADKIPGAKEVIYLNQGIATTTAGTAGQGGRNPTRLAAMLNPSGFRTPDLVILAFGMNDRTDLTYVNDIEQIVLAIKAAGADVIVVGPHQVGPYSASFTDESWHLVQRRLRECADRLDVAFMPNELFYMGKNRGYLGLSDYSLVRANFANHPGPYEYRKQGEALASCFL